MSLSLLSSQDKTDGLDLSIELASPFCENKVVFIGDSTMHKLFLSLETLMRMNSDNDNEGPTITNGSSSNILSLQKRFEEHTVILVKIWNKILRM